jgi:hypothetical protein
VTRHVVLGVWAVVAAGLLACELAGRVGLTIRGRRSATLADLLHALGSRNWSLVAFFVTWMWLGWHLFAR